MSYIFSPETPSSLCVESHSSSQLGPKAAPRILFITHDIALARKVSDRIAVLYRGQVVEEGPTSEVMADPQHEYTRMLLEVGEKL